MTVRRRRSRAGPGAGRPGRAARVGFFGILGSGNLGNDGSLEAAVGFVRQACPDATLDFMAMGPRTLAERYAAPATALQWFEAHAGSVTGPASAPLKVLGRLLDPLRTFGWVRRQDVVIVPGMGVLEATLPLRPWAFPWSMLWLGVAARLTGARLALLSVGSDVVTHRSTRWIVTRAARLAHYRSFRDEHSRRAMCAMGVAAGDDPVYPDLAFALPVPDGPRLPGAVGVGLMAYRGGNDDRRRAADLHAAYLDAMARFVVWLVDAGRPVRLFVGDQEDGPVVADVLAHVRRQRPDLPADRVVAEPLTTLPDLMRRMAAVDTMVAARYHNVLCALKLSLPTVSVGYATKHEVLMRSMGLPGYCLSARDVTFDDLVDRFTAVEAAREGLVITMGERNAEQVRLLAAQFDRLAARLFPGAASHQAPPDAAPVDADSRAG